MKTNAFLIAALFAGTVAFGDSPVRLMIPKKGETVDLTILQSTDIHGSPAFRARIST